MIQKKEKRLGRDGGIACVKNHGVEYMQKLGSDGIKKRWKQYYKDHPEKLAERKVRDAKKKGGASK